MHSMVSVCVRHGHTRPTSRVPESDIHLGIGIQCIELDMHIMPEQFKHIGAIILVLY